MRLLDFDPFGKGVLMIQLRQRPASVTAELSEDEWSSI